VSVLLRMLDEPGDAGGDAICSRRHRRVRAPCRFAAIPCCWLRGLCDPDADARGVDEPALGCWLGWGSGATIGKSPMLEGPMGTGDAEGAALCTRRHRWLCAVRPCWVRYFPHA